MSELLFLVEPALEGGFIARAFGVDIFTEADDLASLHANAREAVKCHFDDDQTPLIIQFSTMIEANASPKMVKT